MHVNIQIPRKAKILIMKIVKISKSSRTTLYDLPDSETIPLIRPLFERSHSVKFYHN